MNKGDIVKVRGGDRSMVIVDLNSEEAECAWYEEREQMRADFRFESLEMVSRSDFRGIMGPPLEAGIPGVHAAN